jgi:hypothetical protein
MLIVGPAVELRYELVLPSQSILSPQFIGVSAMSAILPRVSAEVLHVFLAASLDDFFTTLVLEAAFVVGGCKSFFCYHSLRVVI